VPTEIVVPDVCVCLSTAIVVPVVCVSTAIVTTVVSKATAIVVADVCLCQLSGPSCLCWLNSDDGFS
jgi:hypothetical protein